MSLYLGIDDTMHRIEETEWGSKESDELLAFCEKAGLESAGTPHGKVLKIFYIRGSDGRLEATSRLEIIYDNLFIESVVVREDLRGKGLGKKMMDYAMEKAKGLGFGNAYVAARIPGFYRRLGFKVENSGELLEMMMSECRRCPQYKKICDPSLMSKRIE